MSASNRSWVEMALPLVLVLLGAGCSKEIKADFPRPPATAAIPAPADSPVEEAEEGDEAAPEPVTVAEPEAEPEAEASPPPPAPSPRRARPAPEEDEEEGAVEAPPAEPSSTQLAGAPPVDPGLATKLERASTLLGSLGRRELTPGQAEQFTAARAFVSQARRALEEGDQRRALVLIDKGLILAQDVERLSRP